MARTKGSGTLQKRGRYWLAIWKVDGKRYTRSTKETDRRKAEKRLEEFTRPFRERTELAVIENLEAKVRVKKAEIGELEKEEKKPVKMSLALDVYYKDLDVSEVTDSSDKVYTNMLGKLRRETGVEYAYELTEGAVDAFMAKIKSGASPATYNRYVVFFRRFYDVLAKHDPRITKNPWSRLRKLKLQSPSRRELSDEEVELLVETAYAKDDELGCLFLTAAFTGMRKNDVVKLLWTSVQDGFIDYLPMKTGKNGRRATVPIHPRVAEAIGKMKGRDPERVLPKLAGMTAPQVDVLVRSVFDKAGIKTSSRVNGKLRMSTGFHSLRVYFISKCARAGIPINQIQKMAGHSSAGMSLAYARTTASDLRLPFEADGKASVVLSKETFEELERRRGDMTADEYVRSLMERAL